MADNDRQNRGRDRGNGRDNRPKIELKPVLLPISGSPDKARVTVKVPGKPEKDAFVTFSAGPEDNAIRGIIKIDGKPVAIKVDVDGVARGELNLTGGSPDATHMAACYQGRYSDAVPIPEGEATETKTVDDLSGYELHYHHVALNASDAGHIRLMLSVRNAEGVFKPSKTKISFDHDVQMDGTAVLAGTAVTKDVPEAGLSMNIVFTIYQLKVEVFVEGLNKVFDFNIFGKRLQAKRATIGDGIMANLISEWEGVNPSLRVWFAWLPIAAILAVWLGGIIHPVIYATLLFVGFALYIRKGGDMRARSWNSGLKRVMGTNNAWWATWVTTTLFCLIITLFLTFWGPSAPTPLANSGPMTTQEQMSRNEQIYGKRLTDKQVESRRKLGMLPAPMKDVATGPSAIDQSTNWLRRHVLPDQSGTGWLIRALVLAFAFIGTFIYTFVAFREEMHELAARRHERFGGRRSWLDALLKLAGSVTKNPPRRGGNTNTNPLGFPGWLVKLLVGGELLEIARFILGWFKKTERR